MKTKFLMFFISFIACAATQAQAQELMGFGLDEPEVLVKVPEESSAETSVGDVIPFTDDVEQAAETAKEQVKDAQAKAAQEVEDAAAKMAEKIEKLDKQVADAEQKSEQVQEKAEEAVEEVVILSDNKSAKQIPDADVLTSANNQDVLAKQAEPENKKESDTDTNKSTEKENPTVEENAPVVEEKAPVVEEKAPAQLENANKNAEKSDENAQNTDAAAKDSAVESENPNSLVKNMKLSVEQLEKAKQIRDDSRKQLAKIEAQIEELRHQAHQLEAETVTKFEAILTDEQLQQFQEFRKMQNEI